MTKSMLSDIKQRCRVYANDNDGFWVSQHRLEEYIQEREQDLAKEIRAITEEVRQNNKIIKMYLQGGPNPPQGDN